MMTSQERVKTAIARQVPDRVPIQDGPWRATIQRWYREGLPEGTDVADYFGYDMVLMVTDLSPRFTIRRISEDEEYIVETTPEGGLRRNHRDYSTTPEVLETPIRSKDDWRAMKERLQPDFKRIDWASNWRAYQNARARGRYICYAAACGYDLLQSYVNSERLLMLMADDPEWVKDMVDTISDLILETVTLMYREGFHFDAVWVYNDMGYRNASLFSPSMYKTIIAPSDIKRNERFHEWGMQTILHSCGCVKGLIPSLIDSGFDCLQPLEAKAGMDVKAIKAEYGDRIALFGGINVLLMEDPDDSIIEREIREKFTAGMPGGGYLYHSDHSIPKDVSFRKYQFVMDCVKKYGVYR